MATYRKILDEVTRKPGEVWQTDSGNWSGKRNDGTSYGGMKSKDKAQAWVKDKLNGCCFRQINRLVRF